MAGRIEMYVIKSSQDIPYLVEETERILANGKGKYIGIHIQDEETAKAYQAEVGKNKSLSLIGLANPYRTSFLVRLVKPPLKNGGGKISPLVA